MLLMEAGGRPDARDARGRTPQGMAEQYGLEWKMIFRDKTGVLPQTWVFRKDPREKGIDAKWHSAPLSDEGWHPISTNTFWTHQENPGRWYGTGWYRIDFTVDEVGIDPSRLAAAKRVRLTFGAIDGHPKIWLNGKLLAERDEPMAQVWDKPLSVDVTGVIKADGVNQLAVSCTKQSDAAGLHAGWSRATKPNGMIGPRRTSGRLRGRRRRQAESFVAMSTADGCCRGCSGITWTG